MSVTEANNYLAVHLHQLLSQEKENVFFSPFSISVAMGMLLCGAEGATASELREALGHKQAGINKEDVASRFEQQFSSLAQRNDSYTLAIANSMLSQIGFKVKDKYKEILSKSFNTLMLEVDFARDIKNVVKQINEWVKEKTNNMIPKFLEELDPSTVLVLLNAIYFKGTWKQQFDKAETCSQNFYNKGNKAKKVQMMHIKESFPFYEDKTYQALELPYIGDEIAMLILLPCDKKGLDSLETTLSPTFIQNLKEKRWKEKVKVAIPRFRLEYSKSLIPPFQKLGVKRAFCGGAQFTQLCDGGGVFVTEILHKAVLDVNEEGSEAAAVTMVAMGRCLPRPVPEFVADHPFVIVIYNTKTDLILFMGRVNEL